MENNLKAGQTDFHGFPKIVDNYANIGQRELIKGEMTGRRLVREWDPELSLKRTWHETLDNDGNGLC